MIVLLGLCIVSSATASGDLTETRVGMYSLLAVPDRFDGRNVIVRGYFCKTGRHYGLFPSARDCLDNNMLVGVRLDPKGVNFENPKELPPHGSVVTVKGRFTSWAELVAIDTSYESGEITVEAIYPY